MRTSNRPITLRRRADLVSVPQTYGDQRYWVVKDPLSLRYVRLRDEEYSLLSWLDGRRSLHDLVVEFETKFAPQRVKPAEVSRLIGILHQSGLLISDRPGQGPVLERKGNKRRLKELGSRWLNPLALRFRGIDPTWVFNLVYPLVRPFMSRFGMLLSATLILSACVWAGVRWHALMEMMPTVQQFFTPTNLLVLTVVLALVKVLHEFGHGLVCKHFGGECTELGVMFLIFTPCLYCNVTDSWRFPNKWHRAAVGAAGIFVELNLAAIALFVWSLTGPGLLHQMSLSLIAVASIGTVLFNGNPLMRYDGYYILSDVVEVPNLAERSAAVVRAFFSKHCLGLDNVEDDPLLPERNRGWYALYCVASVVYRWFVTFSILLFLVQLMRPYRLEFVARLLGAFGVATLILGPLWRLKNFMSVPGATSSVKKHRVYWTTAVAAAAVAFVLFVPLPHRIFGTLELQPYGAEKIYVEVAGTVADADVRYGAKVEAGKRVARLSNLDVELAIEELKSKQEQLKAQLFALRREQFDSPQAGVSIPQTVEMLKSIDEQLAEKRLDLERLAPTTHRAGTVFPPPNTDAAPPESQELHAWDGRPLDLVNLGATLEPGTLLCEIGDPTQWQALVVIDQEDVDFIKTGDAAEILLDAVPHRTWKCQVDEVALGQLLETPRRLSNKAGGDLATLGDGGQSERPASTSYMVRVRIEDPDGSLRVGWRGTARIAVAAQPISTRVLRWAGRTFHFNL
jgi:putative peptide zinc metalloprotease protein